MAQRKRQHGFTLVEILVAVAIIGVLMGLGVFAYQKIMSAARLNATRITLGNLKGMLSELEAAQGGSLTQQPSSWMWLSDGGAAGAISPTSTAGVNFWRLPQTTNDAALAAVTPDALIAPGDVANDPAQRNGAFAIVNTNLAMNFIGALPANKSRLSALPANTLMTIQRTGDTQFKGTGNDRYIGFGSDTPNLTIGYVPGVHVRVGSTLYVAGAAFTPNSNPAPPGTWTDETSTPFGSPMLLDGWGNPIIFVPATGLRVRLLNSKDKYDAADATQNFIKLSPEGQMGRTPAGVPYVITPGRPFWASAGRDGDFSKGDDNVYSFE